MKILFRITGVGPCENFGCRPVLAHYSIIDEKRLLTIPEDRDSLGDAAGDADGGVEVGAGDRQEGVAEGEHTKAWMVRMK